MTATFTLTPPIRPLACEYAMTRPIDRLLTGNLAYLMALEANGLERQASSLVAKIADGLRREPRRAAEDDAPIVLPDEERGRSAFDLKRLDAINARLTKGYVRKGNVSADQQREEDLRRREALEREISDRGEERRRVLREAEAAQLAAARGEAITTDASGVRRILDHDPIASLTWLTQEQDAAAKAIRDAYEMRAVDVGAVEYTGMPSGQHDHERFVSKRYERARATMLIGQVATGILSGTFRSQRGSLITVRTQARFERERVSPIVALAMVRAVCGEGLTLTSQGAGRAYDRNRRSLALGLDVAHEVLNG